MSKRSSAKPSETDWKRLDTMTDDEIDFSGDPEATPEMFARAAVRKGLTPIPAKQHVTLRLDADVLEWFQAQGKGAIKLV